MTVRNHVLRSVQKVALYVGYLSRKQNDSSMLKNYQ